MTYIYDAAKEKVVVLLDSDGGVQVFASNPEAVKVFFIDNTGEIFPPKVLESENIPPSLRREIVEEFGDDFGISE